MIGLSSCTSDGRVYLGNIMLSKLLEMVVGAIVEMGVEAAWDKAKRREAVIRVLKRVGIPLDDPPPDFDGVYAYTLVEYGIAKPGEILDFFRHEFIRDAFRRAYQDHDLSILDYEAESFLDWNKIGNDLRRMDIDPRREFAKFAAVFNQVVDRARTPAEIRRDHMLKDIRGDLHDRTDDIIQHLDRLPSLEEIRAVTSQPIEREWQSEPSPLPTGIEYLAQHMRDWFSTLGYQFEDHDIHNEDYFEWIVNVRIQQGYLRVLVRGIEGEAKLHHVRTLRQAVDKHRADQGWLVAFRRVSEAASREADKDPGILAYALDELLDRDADFSGYLEWLEKETRRQSIDQLYVPLAATKDEFDPITGSKIDESHYDRLDAYIDRWLDDPTKEHLSILGEFGTGKTWFALHYAWISAQRYMEDKARGIGRHRLPLFIALRDYVDASSVESLFSRSFFQKYGIPLPGYAAFEQLNRMGKLLLIFDGFDEMAVRVDQQKMIENFWELARVVVPGAKVILTCRREHFPTDETGHRLLGAGLHAPTYRLSGKPPQFEILKLEGFDDDRIHKALSSRAPKTVVQRITNDSRLLDLAHRPLMIEYILEALPDIEAGKPVDLAHVLLYATTRKMDRDIESGRTFTSLADKLYLVSEVSWEMISTGQMRINHRGFPERIRRFFGLAVEDRRDLDHWKHDMMGQAMLIRDEEGNYEVAHRPIAEFFAAFKMAAEMGALQPEFEEVAAQQSSVDNDQHPQPYTWSSYFHRTRTSSNQFVPIAPLDSFEPEALNRLSRTIGSMHFGRAVLEMLAGVTREKPLWDIIEKTQGQDFNAVGYLGGNALETLKLKGTDLTDKDLSKTILAGADLSGANLRRANLTCTNLRESVLRNTNLEDAILIETDLSGADIEQWGAVSSIAVHPAAQEVATAIFDATVKFWSTASWDQTGAIRNLPNACMTIAYSPDGKLLACGLWDGSLIVWMKDESEWKELLRISGDFPLYSVAFSQNGWYLASGDLGGNVSVWEVNTWDQILSSQRHNGAAYCVKFNPQSTVLASCGADGGIRLHDVENWNSVTVLCTQSGYARGLSWSPEGKRLVVGSQNGELIVGDVSERTILQTAQPHTQGVTTVDWSNDGKLIASGGLDKKVAIWEIASKRAPRQLFEYRDTVFAVCFTPDSQHLISGSDEWLIKTWDREQDAVSSLAQSNWKGTELRGLIGIEEAKLSWLLTRSARAWERDAPLGSDPTQLVSVQTSDSSNERRLEVTRSTENLPQAGELDFSYEVIGTDGESCTDNGASPTMPVLAEFSTSWCGPSRMMEQELRGLAKEYESRALVVKVDIDRNSRAFANYEITGIPTLILFKDGVPVDRLEGWFPRRILGARLEAIIDPENTAAEERA